MHSSKAEETPEKLAQYPKNRKRIVYPNPMDRGSRHPEAEKFFFNIKHASNAKRNRAWVGKKTLLLLRHVRACKLVVSSRLPSSFQEPLLAKNLWMSVT